MLNRFKYEVLALLVVLTALMSASSLRADVTGAIQDLEETVHLEPRNFAAFRTLADIAAAREDWKGAYAAWQKVMELDPKTPGGEERLRLLKRKAVGEET